MSIELRALVAYDITQDHWWVSAICTAQGKAWQMTKTAKTEAEARGLLLGVCETAVTAAQNDEPSPDAPERFMLQTVYPAGVTINENTP